MKFFSSICIILLALVASAIAKKGKKSGELEKITHKVYFDIEIGGKSAGRYFE